MRETVEVWLVDNGDYWKAVWSDPDAKGGKKSKSLGPKSKYSRRQARVLCRELGSQLANPSTKPGSAPRLSAWLERYEQSRVDVKEETRETYRHAGAYLLAYFDQDPPVDRISRADAGDWYSALASGELTKDLNAREDAAAKGGKVRYRWRKLSLSTVRRHARAAKQMFQVAVDEDRILFNPFDRLKASPPKPHKAWREVTPVDLERILESCPNMSWKCLFALCRLAGLRRNEALSLEWSHVDWSGNRMRIHEGLEHDTTKKRFRVCPIEPARCPTGLTALLRQSLEQAVDGSTLICAGIGSNNLRRNALAILKRSGVGVYAKPFHTLRKCRISEVALEYPQGIVEEWFGHDEEVSRLHYQRVPEELYAAPSVQDGQTRVGKQSRKQSKTSSGNS
jgi:integrase